MEQKPAVIDRKASTAKPILEDCCGRGISPTLEEIFDYVLDLGRNTTLDGKPRCEHQHFAKDFYGTQFTVRCTAEAEFWLLGTLQGRPLSIKLCFDCCPDFDYCAGKQASVTPGVNVYTI